MIESVQQKMDQPSNLFEATGVGADWGTFLMLDTWSWEAAACVLFILSMAAFGLWCSRDDVSG